jgi:cobalt/nickel transport system permease protein
MHIHFLDPYRSRASLIHALDARVKLVLALAFIITTALVPPGSWAVYILLYALILAIEVLSELGVGYVFKRSLLAIPFVLAALPIIFTTSGGDVVSFTIGSFTIQISLLGLERFISILLKSWISIQAAIVLAASTPFPDLLVAMRAIYIPRMIVAVFGLMWRYLFILADEALRLHRARESRSGHPDVTQGKVGGSVYWRAQVTGKMVGSLFIRALERSDRIYNAMVSRGYDGETRTLPLSPMTIGGWLILFTGIVLLILLLTLAFLL